MDDAEHQDHSILVDDVVHDPVVAHAQPVERVARALDGLDRLAADATWLRCIDGELLESPSDPFLEVGGQLLEGTNRAGRKLDVEGGQSSSLSRVPRPFA